MSYNIDTFKVKKLENLKIPVASFYKSDREDWHPQRHNNDDGSVIFEFGEGAEIKGVIENDMFLVTSIDFYGEGSGSSMNEILVPALKDSRGELIASCVWERGDLINKLIVKNGNVSWEDIEI